MDKIEIMIQIQTTPHTVLNAVERSVTAASSEHDIPISCLKSIFKNKYTIER